MSAISYAFSLRIKKVIGAFFAKYGVMPAKISLGLFEWTIAEAVMDWRSECLGCNSSLSSLQRSLSFRGILMHLDERGHGVTAYGPTMEG